MRPPIPAQNLKRAHRGRVISILDALEDPSLFGEAFAEPSWQPWRAFLGCLFGLPMEGGLAYAVTRMDAHDRLWHRMEKIARRLGDRDPGPEIPPRRPKCMRTATYDRLLEAWHDAGERRDEIYDAKIAGCSPVWTG